MRRKHPTTCGVAIPRRPFPPLPAVRKAPPRRAGGRPAAAVKPELVEAVTVRPRPLLALPAPAERPARVALPEYPGARARGPLGHIVGTARAERPQETVMATGPRKATTSAQIARRPTRKGVQIVEGTPYSPTRLYWPSGRMRPMPGDDVYAVVAGVMGAAFVKGKAVKRGDAIRIVAQGKSRPASELWSVVGDPAIEAAKAEKKQKESDAAKRKEEIKREAAKAVERYAEARGLVPVKSVGEVFVGQTLHRLSSEGHYGDGDPNIIHDDSIAVASVGRDEWTYENEYGSLIGASPRNEWWWREKSSAKIGGREATPTPPQTREVMALPPPLPTPPKSRRTQLDIVPAGLPQKLLRAVLKEGSARDLHFHRIGIVLPNGQTVRAEWEESRDVSFLGPELLRADGPSYRQGEVMPLLTESMLEAMFPYYQGFGMVVEAQDVGSEYDLLVTSAPPEFDGMGAVTVATDFVPEIFRHTPDARKPWRVLLIQRRHAQWQIDRNASGLYPTSRVTLAEIHAERAAAAAPPPQRGITPTELVRRYQLMPSNASFVASRDVPEGMAAAGGDALFTPRALAALQIGRLLSRRVESEGIGLAARKVFDDLQAEAGRVGANQFDRVAIRASLAFRGDEDLGAWLVGIPTTEGVVIDSADAVADDAVVASGNSVPMASILRGDVLGPVTAILTVDGDRVVITRYALRLIGLVVKRLRRQGYGDDEILANLRLTIRQLKRDVAKLGVTVRPGEPVMATLWFGGQTTRVQTREEPGAFVVDAEPPPRIEMAEPEFSPRIDLSAVAQRVGRTVTPKDLIPGDLTFVSQDGSGTRLVVGYPRAIKNRDRIDWSIPAKDSSGRDFPMLLRDGVPVDIVSTPLPSFSDQWPDPALWEVIGVRELAPGDWILLRDPNGPDSVLSVERIDFVPQQDNLTLHMRDPGNRPITAALHYASSVGRWPASTRLALPMRGA